MCGLPLKYQFLSALRELKDEKKGWGFKVALACGSWRKVCGDVFANIRDLEKMQTIGVNTEDVGSAVEQKRPVSMFWRLSVATVSVTAWSFATESLTAPHCFIRILSSQWEEAHAGMEWARSVFEAALLAQRHIDEKQPGWVKLSNCLDDLAYHRDQSVLSFWRAAHASGWNIADPVVRDVAFATNAGVGETKYQLEDLFRHMRKCEADGKNGNVMAVWNILLQGIVSPTMSLEGRNYVKAERYQLEEEAKALKASELIGRTKPAVPEKLRQACLKAMQAKKVVPGGSDASRRAVAASCALVQACHGPKPFEILQKAWIGQLCHRMTCLFNRQERKAFVSLGTWTWSTLLWELEFCGFTDKHWFWAPAPASSSNPCFHTIASEEVWCGIKLEEMPTACTLSPPLQAKCGFVLLGERKGFTPLIQYVLEAIDISTLLSDNWRTLCHHLGGHAPKNPKGYKDKSCWCEGALRAMGFDDESLERQMKRANGQAETSESPNVAAEMQEENDDLLEVLQELGEDGKKDFPDLWTRSRKKRSEKTAAKEIEKYLAKQEEAAKHKDKSPSVPAGKGVGAAESSVTLPSPVSHLMPPPAVVQPAPAAGADADGAAAGGEGAAHGDDLDGALLLDMEISSQPESKASGVDRSKRQPRTPAHLKLLLPCNEDGSQVGSLWETGFMKRYTASYPDAKCICKSIGYPEKATFTATHDGAGQKTTRTRAQALRDVPA